MKQHRITTSDGVGLNVLEAGNGRPLVLIPGWSQAAEQFKFQIEGLADRYRVIAIDMRGHGDSDKPAHGYRIQRLAKDVWDALRAMNLSDVTILGHSMGCSVLWCYFDLFGAERIGKFVFCDEPPFLTSNPAWSEEELANAGAIFSPEAVTGTANALAGPDGVATSQGFVGGMVTSAMPKEQLQWMINCNLKFPRDKAAALIYNHCHQD
jgi:pimeloyl-ACP methyl ester carboxylesterase